MDSLESKLTQILEKPIKQGKNFGSVFALKKGSFQWTGSSGNLKDPDSFFIASTTKLFTTALILKLVAENSIRL